MSRPLGEVLASGRMPALLRDARLFLALQRAWPRVVYDLTPQKGFLSTTTRPYSCYNGLLAVAATTGTIAASLDRKAMEVARRVKVYFGLTVSVRPFVASVLPPLVVASKPKETPLEIPTELVAKCLDDVPEGLKDNFGDLAFQLARVRAICILREREKK